METKVDYTGKVQKTVKLNLDVEMSHNDIFNWLTRCTNIETLRYLGNYALRCARDLENPDDDDFRSRA